METASIRIKFSPLLHSVQRGESRCCLEIVPEVTAVQNLDKIEWTIDDNLVEYTIPMTYRIIIKKQKSSTDKVFHSCVDLLHSYSITNINSPYGDVMRIISDNLILRKLTSNLEKCNMLVTNNATDMNLKDQNTASKLTIQISDVSTLSPTSETAVENSDKRLPSTNEVTRIQEPPDNYETDLKVVDYSKEIFDIDETEEPSDDYLGTTTTPATLNTANYKPTLSLSPICSLNTYDFPSNVAFYKKNTTSNLTFRVLDSPIACPNNVNAYNSHNVKKDIDNAFVKKTERISPQARVAYFVNVMQREISPLKHLLNEIRNKCVSLGVLLTNEKCKANFLLYKTVSSSESQWIKRNRRPKKCNNCISDYDRNQKYNSRIVTYEKNTKYTDSLVMDCCKSHKSNRVVYTVVFND